MKAKIESSIKRGWMARWRRRLTAGLFACAIVSFAGWPISWVRGQPAGGDAPPPVPAEEQPEVLTRGPVHEAFAQPVNLESQAGLVAPTKPPANIEEEPPAERPEGDNYVWVPGYWSWDTDRKDYVWVSACWRVAPANMSWVPGYWAETDGGWEWVAGFWQPTANQEIEYLPAPPEPEDPTPPGAPPSPDQIWVPPCHYWRDGHYVPRHGYWLGEQTGWVWAPSHYVWTPRGHVFCDGHWDCSLDRRGVLFAPVYIRHEVYSRAGFTYSPSIVVESDLLTANLFACPSYSHYYFGDYYDDSYAKIGIFPRFETERIHTWYDPLFVYDRWQNHGNPHWEEGVRHDFEVRRADVNLRPARTFREQEIRVAKLPEAERRNVRVAQPLKTIVSSKTTNIKFQQINVDARKQIAVQASEVHKFRDQRNTWESGKSGEKTTPTRTPERKTTGTPPIESKEPRREPTNVPAKEPSREPVKTPTKEPAVQSREKEPAARTEEHKSAVTPARDTHRTEPERVKIPTPSVSGKSHEGTVEKSPSPPAGERERRTDVKEAPKSDVKEAPKGKDDKR
jgi:hypothetical protein